jgi:hypothetical protein
MTSYELFAAMPGALAAEILEFNHQNERRLYRAALEAVAQSRKLRAVFLERQPRSEQHALLVASLGRPPLGHAADSLLRNWLLKKHSALLMDFLNALGIKHENGVVEDLPKAMNETTLQNAVDTLLTRHPRGAVTVYLHAFNAINGEHWESLENLLRMDPRLNLGASM